MKCLLICHAGLEAVCAKEVSEILGVTPTMGSSVVIAEVDTLFDICRLCYLSHTAIRVLLLLSESKSNIEDIKLAVSGIDMAEWLSGQTFAVRAEVIDATYSSQEACEEVGEVLFDKFKSVSKVDLENPVITVFVHSAESTYIGIDFAGFELSKRNYKLFHHSDSIKASVAYSLLRLAAYKSGKVLIDPFTQSGTITIEAALHASNRPVRFYEKDRFAFLKFPQFSSFDFNGFFEDIDKQQQDAKDINAIDFQQNNLRASEKNAKAAGVNKFITFSRTEIEYLDTKFEKLSVDCIVTNPPKPSREASEKKLERIFKEFFYTAEFILKKSGRIVLFSKKYTKFLREAQRYNFTLKKNIPIKQGKEDFNVLIFEKA